MWRPLAGIICDLQPPRIPEMKAAGITKVKILCSGGDDCPMCSALVGKTYSIDEVPTVPPDGCTCIPWCRCIEIAVP